MAQEVYNVVNYEETRFKYSMTSVEYGPLHLHKEIEISLLLYGSCRVDCMGEELLLEAGDMWIVNSLKSHQYRTMSDESRAIILELQLTPDFFEKYFPQMGNIEFSFSLLSRKSLGEENYRNIANVLLGGAECYFNAGIGYQLEAAAAINRLFYLLICHQPYKVLTEEERLASQEKTYRLRSLVDYINAHYGEALYLTELAEQEGLSMSRLSHVFRECFGISFQEYLSQVRCSNAKVLLETTELKLLDISMECGFSDPKYFNRDFKKHYKLPPKEYRRRYQERRKEAIALGYVQGLEDHYLSPLTPGTTVEDNQNIFGEGTLFYYPEDALVVLQYCKEENLLGTL